MHPSDHVRCRVGCCCALHGRQGRPLANHRKGWVRSSMGRWCCLCRAATAASASATTATACIDGVEWGGKKLQQRLRNLFVAGGREGGPTIALGGVNASTLSRSLKHSFGFPYLLGSRLFACVAAIPLRNHKIPRVLAQDAPPKVIVSQ